MGTGRRRGARTVPQVRDAPPQRAHPRPVAPAHPQRDVAPDRGHGAHVSGVNGSTGRTRQKEETN